MHYQVICSAINIFVKKGFRRLKDNPIYIQGETWRLALEPRSLIVVSNNCHGDEFHSYQHHAKELLAMIPHWLRIIIYHGCHISLQAIQAIRHEIIGLHFHYNNAFNEHSLHPQIFGKIWKSLPKLDYLVYDIPHVLPEDMLESFRLLLQAQFQAETGFCHLNVLYPDLIHQLLYAVTHGWCLQSLSLILEYKYGIDITLGDFLRYNQTVTELEIRTMRVANDKFLIDVMESLAYNHSLKHLTLTGTNLPDDFMSSLKWNATLQHFHIAFDFSHKSYDKLLVDAADVLRHNSTLLSLHMCLDGYHGIPDLTDFNPIDIALKYNQKLQTLQLKGIFDCDYFEFMTYNPALQNLHVRFVSSCYSGLALELQHHLRLVDITLPPLMEPEMRRQIKSKLKSNAQNNFMCHSLVRISLNCVSKSQALTKIAGLRDDIPQNIYHDLLQTYHITSYQ